MLHQPWGGTQGTAADIHLQAEEILRNKRRLNEILAKHSGQSVDKVQKDSDRDYFMSAIEAKNYGLVDEVVASLKDCPEAAPSKSTKAEAASRA